MLSIPEKIFEKSFGRYAKTRRRKGTSKMIAAIRAYLRNLRETT